LATWGLDDDVAGLERFSRGLVAALADQVGVFKPQSAFFEAHGPAGLSVLARVLDDIGAAGALSILDVKRGDIGSTMAAYARAYLADGAPLAADAITVNPYLGFGSLAPAVEQAGATGRGLFVLARTSNPEGPQVQDAVRQGSSVAQSVVAGAVGANRAQGTALVGLVLGATRTELGVDLAGFDGWILAPGVGAQGGRMDALAGLFGDALPRVLPSASREIAGAGPDPSGLRDRVSALQDAAGTQVHRIGGSTTS
jgi:orotidine-5'-phosphate decarboxylase